MSKVIERLRRVEVSPKNFDQKNKTMGYKTDPSSPEPKAPDPVIELERVSTTNHAVYQTFKTQNDCESIKTEIDEVNNLLTNHETLLGPDGKLINNQTSLSSNKSSPKDNISLNGSEKKLTKAFCKLCKIHFQTEKTLNMHVQKKHNSSTYVFQCPTCSLTFLQPAAVIRHLANEHKQVLQYIYYNSKYVLSSKLN